MTTPPIGPVPFLVAGLDGTGTGLVVMPRPPALPVVWAGLVTAGLDPAGVAGAVSPERSCPLLPEHGTGWFGRPGLQPGHHRRRQRPARGRARRPRPGAGGLRPARGAARPAPRGRVGVLRERRRPVPPEYLGAHVAPPFSHQTGRFMPLSLRCATALFGHFGVEWDITQAPAGDLAELTAWIALYKRHRGLIHSGRVRRVGWVSTCRPCGR